MAERLEVIAGGKGVACVPYAATCNMAEGHSAVVLYRSGLIKDRKGVS